jgi:chemotaxis protein MotB
MAAADKKSQIIVVKRIKKGGHGHHGGAWKIAYADFVTAMMAFFLLMWLLGSTTKGELLGIAEHFNTPLKVALSGGSGSGDSSSVVQGGGTDLTRSAGQVKRGEIESTQRRQINLQAARNELRREEQKMLEELKQKLEAAIAANPRVSGFSGQIKLDFTPEGLRIQIVDDQNRAMFDSGSAIVKDYMRELLREIGKVLNEVPNKVSLAGHTDSAAYGGGQRGYSNWELSADRANASRRELVAGGMDDGKVMRVVGLASAVPMETDNPRHPVNRRISIVVMNRAAESRLLNGAELADEAGGEGRN